MGQIPAADRCQGMPVTAGARATMTRAAVEGAALACGFLAACEAILRKP